MIHVQIKSKKSFQIHSHLNDENDDQTQDSQVFPKFSGGNVLSSFFLDSNFPSLPNLPRNCWWTLLMKARFPFVWQSLQ